MAGIVVDVGDLPKFALADLVNKDEIGREVFATFFTAEFYPLIPPFRFLHSVSAFYPYARRK